jgi:hypothetical protein
MGGGRFSPFRELRAWLAGNCGIEHASACRQKGALRKSVSQDLETTQANKRTNFGPVNARNGLASIQTRPQFGDLVQKGHRGK